MKIFTVHLDMFIISVNFLGKLSYSFPILSCLWSSFVSIVLCLLWSSSYKCTICGKFRYFVSFVCFF